MMCSLAMLLWFAAQWVGGEWEEKLHLEGGTAQFSLGQAVAGLADFDHDGRLDFVIGSEGNQSALPIYSGLDALQIGLLVAPPYTFYFGQGLGRLGDLDLDGVPDFGVAARALAGSTDRFCVHLFSGRTGAYARTIFGTLFGPNGGARSFGQAMACPGDLNGDGVPEILLGERDAFGLTTEQPGAVYIFSGADLALLDKLVGAQDGAEFGDQLLATGDLDGDGVGDFAVASPMEDASLNNVGAVRVFSGATRALLWLEYGISNGDFLGSALASLPDLDGDGAPEVVIGAIDGGDRIGRALVRSGRTGATFWERSISGESFGRALAAVQDLNGDGITDLAVGATLLVTPGTTTRGGVYVISGSDGSTLLLHGGYQQTGGWVLAALGDAQNDGIGELISASPGADRGSTFNVGAVSYLTFRPGLTISTAEVSASAGGVVGLRIEFPLARAGADYALLLSASGAGPTSLSGIEVPLSADNLFRLSRVGIYPFPGVGMRGTLDADGRAHARARLDPAQLAGQVGRTLWWAAVAGTGGTVETSSIARTVTITP